MKEILIKARKILNSQDYRAYRKNGGWLCPADRAKMFMDDLDETYYIDLLYALRGQIKRIVDRCKICVTAINCDAWPRMKAQL